MWTESFLTYQSESVVSLWLCHSSRLRHCGELLPVPEANSFCFSSLNFGLDVVLSDEIYSGCRYDGVNLFRWSDTRLNTKRGRPELTYYCLRFLKSYEIWPAVVLAYWRPSETMRCSVSNAFQNNRIVWKPDIKCSLVFEVSLDDFTQEVVLQRVNHCSDIKETLHGSSFHFSWDLYCSSKWVGV